MLVLSKTMGHKSWYLKWMSGEKVGTCPYLLFMLPCQLYKKINGTRFILRYDSHIIFPSNFECIQVACIHLWREFLKLYSSLHGFINFCGFVFVKIPQNRYVYFPERKCVENIFFLLFSALSGRIFLLQNFLFISFFFFDCSVICETNQQEKMFVQ